jgi:uncharacterized membrane protein YeaQ/YmgE (transglycosylase-associated protein family)
MGLLTYLILIAVLGLIMGSLARLALPGPDPMSLPMTILVGIAGSFLGGIVARLITGSGYGLFAAFAGSFAIVYLIRRSRGGTLTRPGRDVPPRR